MPNYCNYSMLVKGKRENINEFIKVIKENYNYNGEVKNKHLFRVFEAYHEEINHREGDIYDCIITGNCAWSVHSCMFDGEHTYYNQFKELYGEDSMGTTIPILSKELELSFEIFSEECGMCFQEHFIVINGEIIVENCVDYMEIYTDGYNSVDELNESNNTNFTEEEFESSDWLSVGGFDWNFTI